jgi:hypothetical protein
LKSGSNTVYPSVSCGSCSKTIKIRGETDLVLCTDSLDIVDAGFEDVCECFEDRAEPLEQTCWKIPKTSLEKCF